MVSIQPNDKDLHIEKSNDLLYNYYRSHEFAARNTPLWRVVNILNEAYDAHIQIQGKELQNTPLTATFKEESLDKILQVLMLTTPGIHMQKTGQAIILKKN
jgi:ferric-dicitrate binding protein FerR (iron transport regulator)